MRVKCIVEYNGSKFNGWQRQNKELNNHFPVTIQGEIEDILTKFYKEKIFIHGSSRTDAGVHAVEQVFHFDNSGIIPIENIKKILNKNLSPYIRIKSVELVDDKFHSRYDVMDKTYKYIVNIGKYNVYNFDTEFQYCKPINFELVDAAINIISGKNDFKAFMASGSDKVNTIRTINYIKYIIEDEKVIFYINADGFLYNMVRIIIGVFINLSEKVYKIDDLKIGLIQGDRKKFKYTAPANGLYLYKINFK